MRTILIKINKAFDGHKPNQLVKVECDLSDIPFNLSWRRRLKDAELDRCCEIVKPVEKVAEQPIQKPKKSKSHKSSGDKS